MSDSSPCEGLSWQRREKAEPASVGGETCFRIRYLRSLSTSVVQLFAFPLFISLLFCEVIFREFQPV